MSLNKPMKTDQKSQSLASAALSHILTVEEENAELLSVMVHFTSAVTQTATVTLARKVGGVLTNYVWVLDTSSLSGAVNYIFRPTGVVGLKRGDTLTVAVTNSGTPAITAYSEILYRENV